VSRGSAEKGDWGGDLQAVVPSGALGDETGTRVWVPEASRRGRVGCPAWPF
jgi:hypothetical protein